MPTLLAIISFTVSTVNDTAPTPPTVNDTMSMLAPSIMTASVPTIPLHTAYRTDADVGTPIDSPARNPLKGSHHPTQVANNNIMTITTRNEIGSPHNSATLTSTSLKTGIPMCRSRSRTSINLSSTIEQRRLSNASYRNVSTQTKTTTVMLWMQTTTSTPNSRVQTTFL